MFVTELKREAKALKIRNISTMNKAALIEAIRKVKYKDASTQTDGPYCEQCVTIAGEKNLEQYARERAEKNKRVVYDRFYTVDPDSGEVIF